MDQGGGLATSSKVGSPALNLELFESNAFNVDAYVKRVAAESVYASSISEAKEKLQRVAAQTGEEIKNSVFKNYANIMETSREVGHLEGKMSQLRQSLDEQRKLLAMFKNWSQQANTVLVASGMNQQGGTKTSSSSSATEAASNTSLSLILEQVEGCGLIAQKSGRTLLYHSDLDSLHLDDFSISHRAHAYLLNDAILLALPQRKRCNLPHQSSHRAGSAAAAASAAAAGMGSGTSSSSYFMSGGGGGLHGKSSRVDSASGAPSSSSYLYKFQAFYELQDIKIINIEDSKEVRNAFQLLKFPQSLAFRCSNAHIKKEWLENIESAKRQLRASQSTDEQFYASHGQYAPEFSTIAEEDDELGGGDDDGSGRRLSTSSHNQMEMGSSRRAATNLDQLKSASETERKRILRDLFAEFDILLAQRDFEKTVDMLLKIIKHAQTLDTAQQLVYKQKQSELIQTLRRDLAQAKERGNSKGVVKTGKRVVNSLIKLNIYDEAIDLFIDYHKYLNAETLKRIKLEESNHVYMTNVLSSFFENLKLSFHSFREQFANLLNYCYSTYIAWCDTEIEILIKKLQSQHYLGRHFDVTIENSELIMAKANEFSRANQFEVVFLVETKLTPVLDTSIREQLEILIDASLQRSKLELENTSNKIANDQSRQLHIDNFLKDIELHELKKYFEPADIELLSRCTSASIQFARGSLNFFVGCMRVYFLDINFLIVETFTKLFKAEHKLYSMHLSKGGGGSSDAKTSNANRLNKRDVYHNVCLVEKTFAIVRTIYQKKTGIDSKYFVKLAEKYAKFRDEIAS